MSRHGSPMYQYEEVSNNPKWEELFQAFQCLENYMKHADSPQWGATPGTRTGRNAERAVHDHVNESVKSIFTLLLLKRR